jgi:hypothetical protein
MMSDVNMFGAGMKFRVMGNRNSRLVIREDSGSRGERKVEFLEHIGKLHCKV